MTAVLLLASCGSGDPANDAGAQGEGGSVNEHAPATLASDEPAQMDTLVGQAAAPGANTNNNSGASGPSAQLAGTNRMTSLAVPSINGWDTATATAPTTQCAAAYVPSPAATATGTSPMPATGGVFYNAADLVKWRSRVARGPFAKRNDYQPGSPGDWEVIAKNAKSFNVGIERKWASTAEVSLRATHGTRLRDAAFYQLVTKDATLLAKVRARLLEEADNPANDFKQLCLRTLDGSTPDASYFEANWLLRYTVSYDFARAGLSTTDRARIDAFIRRNAHFFAAQLDHGLDLLFPDRSVGKYTRRGRDAESTGEAGWVSARGDTNGDCTADASDGTQQFPAYAYVTASGARGPRVSVVSQWYNNRRSQAALAIGSAGVVLADPALIANAKRYFMEWLTYAVWPDGSEGEYVRNGDYCIPNQGVIYSFANIQGALLLSRELARQGDTSLFQFRTRDGLFGTEADSGESEKSIELVARTHLRLIAGQLPWYQHELQAGPQRPRAATHLGRTDVYYHGAGKGADAYHDLGLLAGAEYLPMLPIKSLVLREAVLAHQPYPGTSGRPVATGFGSWVGSWTDTFNALPAALLIY